MKKIACVIVAVMSIILLASCNGQSRPAIESGDEERSADELQDHAQLKDEYDELMNDISEDADETDTAKTEEPKVYSFSEYLDNNPRSIWFYIEDGEFKPEFGKETYATYILVFENNTVTYYRVGNEVTLGRMARMTDDEIIELLESGEEGRLLDLCADFTIGLYTDATGNNVYQESICWYDENAGGRYTPPYGAVYKLEGGFDFHEVYNAVYAGYTGDSDYNNAKWNGLSTDFFFVTRVNMEEVGGFKLDSMDLEDALIDPTDEDVLEKLLR